MYKIAYLYYDASRPKMFVLLILVVNFSDSPVCWFVDSKRPSCWAAGGVQRFSLGESSLNTRVRFVTTPITFWYTRRAFCMHCQRDDATLPGVSLVIVLSRRYWWGLTWTARPTCSQISSTTNAMSITFIGGRGWTKCRWPLPHHATWGGASAEEAWLVRYIAAPSTDWSDACAIRVWGTSTSLRDPPLSEHTTMSVPDDQIALFFSSWQQLSPEDKAKGLAIFADTLKSERTAAGHIPFVSFARVTPPTPPSTLSSSTTVYSGVELYSY